MFLKVHKLFVLLPVIFGVVAQIPISESNYGKPNDQYFDSWSTTEFKVNVLRYTWNISDYSLLEQQLGEVLKSPTFSDTPGTECSWRLELYPQGVNSENKGYLSLYLRSLSCNADAIVKFGLLNANGEEIENKEFIYKYTADEVKGWNKFVKEELLLDEESGYLVDDTLTIFCDVNASSISQEFLKEVKQSPPENELELRKDLAFLINNQVFSDVTICAKGKNFQALKGILSARSPVFKDIFEQDTPDSKVSHVFMEEFDPKVVQELLRYIYTDETSDLQDLTPDLLVLAEDYQLKGLKKISENAIVANLTIENAAQFYVLGDKYSAVQLKVKAKDFIRAHASDVMETVGYKSLLQTHPHFAEELGVF